MPKTIEIVNNFEWAETLECPPSACSHHVKKILNHGITGIWWEEIGSKIYPANDVLDIRKNLLLYYLKTHGQSPSIQHIRNTERLKSVRSLLKGQVVNLQVECELKEKSMKEKVLKLEKIRAAKKAIETKRNLLQLSHREMKDKMKNCKDMKAVCQELLPPSQSGIDESLMIESLTLVGGISSRSDKRNAWKQLQETLGSIATPELWDWILKSRIQNNEESCKLEVDGTGSSKKNSQLDLEIASARGKLVKSSIAKHIYEARTKEYQACCEEYLEFLEQKSGDNEEMSNWLMTVLEVTKYEAVQKTLQIEIEKIKHFCEEQNNVCLKLHEVESEINETDYQMEQQVQTLYKCLGLLEAASNFLLTLKDNLATSLNSILSLTTQQPPAWMSGNLSYELGVFQENLDIDALNKTMLRGKVGAYRHIMTCMGNAQSAFQSMTSSTPVIHPSLYHLITCYLEIIANKILREKKQQSEIANHLDLNLKSSLPSFTRENDIMELLDEGCTYSKKCKDEIVVLHSIFDAWCHQPVQEVMAINDSIVHGATYNEWVQRYSTLVYMLERSK